jgi:hypothetical protein
VFSSAHWRIYRVLAATPLLSGPGRLSSLGHDSFSFYARTAGSFFVRVHFTRYWTVTQGEGCVTPGGSWIWVRVGRPGEVVVSGRFSFARVFEPDGSCSGSESRGSSPKRPV